MSVYSLQSTEAAGQNDDILKEVVEYLKGLVKSNKNNFFVVLNGIHLHYPAIVERYETSAL